MWLQGWLADFELQQLHREVSTFEHLYDAFCYCVCGVLFDSFGMTVRIVMSEVVAQSTLEGTVRLVAVPRSYL